MIAGKSSDKLLADFEATWVFIFSGSRQRERQIIKIQRINISMGLNLQVEGNYIKDDYKLDIKHEKQTEKYLTRKKED